MGYVVKKNQSYSNQIFLNIAADHTSNILDKYTINNESISALHIKIGIELFYNKDFNQAIDFFNSAINLFNSLYAYIYRGIVYAVIGNNLRSIADFQKVLDLDPGNYSIHFAQYLYNDIIENGFPSIINLNTNTNNFLTAQCYFHRGNILAIDKQYQEALQYLNLTIELYPEYHRADYVRTFINNIKNAVVIEEV